MKKVWQILILLSFMGASFYVGTLVTKSTAQAQDRDAQGRVAPMPKFPMAEPKSSLGVIGDIAFRVTEVSPNSPAQQLGLQKGDIIVELDKKQFYSINDFMAVLAEKNPGENVDISLVRFNNQTCAREFKAVNATLVERPSR